MDVIELLALVIQVVTRDTGNQGAADDSDNIDAFLSTFNAGGSIPFELLGAVSGIPFSHFFAESEDAFSSLKGRIWQDITAGITQKVGDVTIVEPAWGFDNTVGQVSSYLDRFV